MGSGRVESGSAVVRTRPDGATELRVNGVFVVDDRETTSERLLARSALAATDHPGQVIVGGLGLGHTLRELLADPRVAHVVVAETETAILTWMRDGRLPGADLLDDPRVTVRAADVRDAVAGAERQSLDLVLLDVDNGPDHLARQDNAGLYQQPFLRQCADRLSVDGSLVIWSQADSRACREALAAVFDHVETERVPVRLQQRDDAYWLLRGTHPRPRPAGCPIASDS